RLRSRLPRRRAGLQPSGHRLQREHPARRPPFADHRRRPRPDLRHALGDSPIAGLLPARRHRRPLRRARHGHVHHPQPRLEPPLLMKRLLLSLLLFLPCASCVRAQSADADRTLSPYSFVKTDHRPEAGGADLLPLKSTRIDAVIAGVIAEVRVTQTYANTGVVPL